jgi:hypothetical protein
LDVNIIKKKISISIFFLNRHFDLSAILNF